MIPGQSQQFFEAAAAQAAGGGYEIERSLRFNSADSAYLDRTPSAEGNRKTWTWSGWVKKAGLGTQSFLFASIPSNLDNYVQIYFSTDQLVINTKTSGNAFTSTKTAGLFRDPSAWYHLVVAIDTTATSNSGKDRLKIYINGRLLGDSDYQSDGRASIALNSDLRINSTNAHHIGKQGEYSGTYANVYLAEVHFIDGQALAATDFGEFDSNSVWQPKEFAGSYTTSGVSFDFAEQQLYAGGTREALFDGSTSTYCSFQRTTGSSGDPSNTKRIKVTFPTAKTGVTKLRIYGGGNLSSTNKVWYNDDESTMIDNDDPVDWKTVYSGSAITINSISFGTSVGGSNLRAIEINDVVLTDAIEYGLNSFHLDFSDNSSSAALGTDSSGNGNTWTVNNINAADGSATTVGEATGALPIRNTTGDQGGTPVSGFRSDSFADDLFLALPLNTDTSDVSNSINTSSTTKSITNQNTATSSTQSRFYGASSYWNANTDGILVAESGSELVVGTGDFTIELWFYDDSNHGGGGSGRCYLFDNRIGGSIVGDPPTITGYVDGSATINFGTSGGGTISHSLSTDNKWIHFAAVRDSGTTNLYINGTSVGSHSDTTNYTNNGIGVGRATDGGYGWAGYIQDFRVYKAAKYTSDFNPPALADPAVGADCDSLIDTPTNYEADSGNNGGNYCTLNPLDKSADYTLQNGNLDFVTNGINSWEMVRATFAVSSGKWYWEFTAGDNETAVGIAKANASLASYIGADANGWSYFYSGDTYNSSINTAYGDSFTTNDVIGVAFDADAGSLYFYKNGTVQNSGTAAFTGLTSGPYFPGFSIRDSGSTSVVNFGQRPFAYTPPTGYKSLCTTNLPNPTIADGSTYFTAVKYAGNSGDGLPTTQDIVTTFSPDLVWIKDRSGTNSHHLFDIIRGAGKRIFSNSTAAETNVISTLSAFNSDGFTVNGNNAVNDVGSNYISWCWDAGTSNATISAGSLNSSAYDQSQTWSDSLTASSGLSGATNAFDGDLSTRAQSSAGTNQTLTFAPSTGVSFTSTLEVYCDQGDSTPTASWNGNTVNPGGGAWVTVFTGSGTINATYPLVIDTQSASQFATLKGVRLDGKILVDSGVTPPNVPLIASTVRANPSAGFSIVSYTGNGTAGTTVGHSLNAAPEFVLHKTRDSAVNWIVYHEYANASPAEGCLFLDLTSGFFPGGAQYFNNTKPSSSVLTLGTNIGLNKNGDAYIAYCFAPVEGFSAFGSYTGNGSTDGPFIFTGFKVRWLMYKRTDAANSWQILDTERDPANVNNLVLIADLANAESTGTGNNDQFDMLSNGFKVRSSNFAGNASGGTYSYAAFAENPFKTARAR